jgi:hypothetical protein
MPTRFPSFSKSVASIAFISFLLNKGITYDDDIPAEETWQASSEKRKWKHSCGHIFISQCRSLLAGTGCPYPGCCASPKLICECEKCFPFSVKSKKENLMSRQLEHSNENQTDAALTLKSSNKDCLWNCLKCQHNNWLAPPHRVLGQGCGCPYPGCSKPGGKRICDCETCFPHSVESEKENLKIRQLAYSKGNPISAKLVLKNSNKNVLWDCLKCGHTSWLAQPANLIGSNKGCAYPGCGYTPRRICECNHCFPFSVASAEKDLGDRFLSYGVKNLKSAKLVFKNSNTHVIWDCLRCKTEFLERPSNVVVNKRGCPNCAKGISERRAKECIEQFVLRSGYCLLDVRKATPWLLNPTTNCLLLFDILIGDEKNNLVGAVEIDGKQHFDEVVYFNSNAENERQNDVFKSEMALSRALRNKESFFLIRIPTDDIYADKWKSWKTALLGCLEDLLKPTEKAQATIRYISSTPEVYNEHRKDLQEAMAGGVTVPRRPKVKRPRLASPQLEESS